MKSLFVLFIPLFLMGAMTAHAEFKVPPLYAAVTDPSHVLSPGFKERLNAALKALSEQTPTQLAVFIAPDLGGTPIENASIQVVDKWQLGKSATDRGLLLIVAMKERAVRIEVGQGLEGDIPDATAKRIVADIITPQFKAGEMDKGVYLGVQALITYAEPHFKLQSYFDRSFARSGRSSGGTPGWLVVVIIVFVLFMMMFGGGRGRRGFYGGMGGFGGGGFGGGSWGGGSGGGFSGGGGGFSGGGASGNW